MMMMMMMMMMMICRGTGGPLNPCGSSSLVSVVQVCVVSRTPERAVFVEAAWSQVASPMSVTSTRFAQHVFSVSPDQLLLLLASDPVLAGHVKPRFHPTLGATHNVSVTDSESPPSADALEAVAVCTVG